MTLELLPQPFTVCQLSKLHTEENRIPMGDFVFFAGTDQETSLVCPTPFVPSDVSIREDGFRAFRIVGPLPFSMIGVLAKISDILARAEISIFVVSTYDTDYIFVKEHQLAAAQTLLAAADYSWQEVRL